MPWRIYLPDLDFSRWRRNVHRHDHPASFANCDLQPGIHSIALTGAFLNVLFRPASENGAPLIVFFSAAAQRGPGRAPPFFAGVDLTERLPASLLAIDDPSLQLDPLLGLAWHSGSKDNPLQSILPGIVRTFAAACGSERIILTGPSGGGFASLYYGTQLTDAIVLAINPQTEILRYLQSHVHAFAKVCFGWDGVSSISDALSPIVQSLPEHFVGGALANGVVVQNATDWHVAKHTLPLIKALGGQPKPIDQDCLGLGFLFRTWGDGHAPIPKASYAALLSHIILHGATGLGSELDASLQGRPEGALSR
jgi:hypothetical protein